MEAVSSSSINWNQVIRNTAIGTAVVSTVAIAAIATLVAVATLPVSLPVMAGLVLGGVSLATSIALAIIFSKKGKGSAPELLDGTSFKTLKAGEKFLANSLERRYFKFSTPTQPLCLAYRSGDTITSNAYATKKAMSEDMIMLGLIIQRDKKAD